MKLWSAILYVLARFEVLAERLANRVTSDNECEDLLPLRLIPSVASIGSGDRVLAEIDQDGFLFAVDPGDAQFFETRAIMTQRRTHRVQIVLAGGVVRLRKSSICRGCVGIRDRLLKFLRWEFYLEAAALLRLRGLSCVPAIRRIDPSGGIIEMDYIWGKDLRHVLADGATKIDYDEIARMFSTFLSDSASQVAIEVMDTLSSVMNRGVMPRDIHAANFIRAWRSGKLYLVDFHLIHLSPIPGWRTHAENLARELAKQTITAGGS